MNPPIITIAICTYNREDLIPMCLKTLVAQTAEKTLWEVVIVDNNSSDRTSEISKTFIANNKEKINIRYVFEGQQGLSFARNRCIAEAQGEYIAFIDDDVELHENYVLELINFFQREQKAVGVGGKTITKYVDGEKPKWISKYLYGLVGQTDHGDETKKYTKAMKYPIGANMTYRKDILQKAGGFNNELKNRADDKYIFNQVVRIDDNIFYNPNVYSRHLIDKNRLSYESFRKLYIKTGEEEMRRMTSEGKKGKNLFLQIAKFGAGFGLWIIYALKGKAMQGRYIFLSQYYALRGCLSVM